MSLPNPEIKKSPERRWNQPDRVFFGFGACHILAGVFLEDTHFDGFFGEWIVPSHDFPGNHMFVTNGSVAFDFHGYTLREKLLSRYWCGHQSRFPGWRAELVKIDFPLLDTAELNARKHLGPDQYFGDPVARARSFIAARKCPAHLLQLI